MERVIFKKNPLDEVILQFMFPTILSINANDPVDFQEAIRQSFPRYRVMTGNQQEFQIERGISGGRVTPISNKKNKNYEFVSADGRSKLNLTSSFIAISTLSYTRWEDFWGAFEEPLSKFIEIYKPAFFERIGLRYVDIISRNDLGLKDKRWDELIKQDWLGVLAFTDEDKVKLTHNEAEFVLDDGVTRLKIRTGLGERPETREKVFVADTDYIYVENIKTDQYDDIVSTLHGYSKYFIENIITETLIDAMEPEPL